MAILRGATALTILALLALVIAPARRLGVGRQAASGRSAWPQRVCRLLCRLLGLRFAQTGAPFEPGPVLLLPNHVSWLDIPALGAIVDGAFIAKREIGAWPAVGALARATGAIFVDRSRKRLIPKTNLEIAACLSGGRRVALFAEGTTGDGSTLLRFGSSHVQAAGLALERSAADVLAVQPVAIVYRDRRGLPLGRAGRASVAWYGDTEFLPHLWSILRGGPISCEIRVGAPIPFRRDSDRKAVAAEARRVVRRLLDEALGAPGPRPQAGG